MAVAPSFRSFTQLCDPFESNNKLYVKVKNEKTGTIRTVRWYPNGEDTSETRAALPKGTQKTALGFEKGYITIFKGINETNEDFFRLSPACRYATWWGWYVPSTLLVPTPLPEGVEAIQLDWEKIGKEDDRLVGEAKVRESVDSLFFEPGTSDFVGEVGQRIALELTVINNIPIDTAYGKSAVHIMQDKNGNEFVWTTASKNWAVGSTHRVRATIKEHRRYQNTCQNVVQRCTEY